MDTGINLEEMKKQLTTDPLAAKRTIERIKLHQNSLSPDFMILFPGQDIEKQQELVEKSKAYDDPIDFWKAVLPTN